MCFIYVTLCSSVVFMFIVHSIPVIIVQPCKRCKIGSEFVPASYAINRLYNMCLCSDSVFPISWSMLPGTLSEFPESSPPVPSLMRPH